MPRTDFDDPAGFEVLEPGICGEDPPMVDWDSQAEDWLRRWPVEPGPAAEAVESTTRVPEPASVESAPRASQGGGPRSSRSGEELSPELEGLLLKLRKAAESHARHRREIEQGGCIASHFATFHDGHLPVG